uniref:DUF3732 domain-containing protein n=1 Tax=Candidatus Kentrum eta TaxID=2126337 RepID=A0A450VB17_9GAMM|nr:MAG: Protein of unknown function (DUF3732) [Candidatus Kentron sp. H]VFJ95756.1 MAG: Protein of unknown function (DUF3732) [Candidatus Kentron sp. H]VFK01967.1 MAG: Protein of unknown function (DUF3732) [Candidatus Kentron sp. H]
MAKKKSSKTQAGEGKRSTNVPGSYRGFSLQATRFLYHLLTMKPDDIVSLEYFEDVGVEKPDGVKLAELRAWAVRAREYGLIDQPIATDANRDALITIMERVIEQEPDGTPSAEGIEEASKELVALGKEEFTVSTQLGKFRRRLAEMLKLQENATRFKDALSIQRDRLAVSKWLHGLKDESHSCPVCNHPLQTDGKVAELLASLEDIEATVRHAGQTPLPAAFDREMVRVKEEIALATESLKGIAARKKALEARSKEAEQISFRQSHIARFLGRVEKGLEMHQALGRDSALAGEVVELEQREKDLREKISEREITNRKRRALDKIALFAGRLLPGLDAEFANEPIELSIADLTVKIKRGKREDYLWEIGSGANWLAYHVAVSLALQQFFLKNPPSPVPSFLVYDQPSQVYFPRRLTTPDTDDEEPEPVLKDEDIEAVQKVFKTIADVVRQSSDLLQALVLDHAGPDIWRNIPDIHLVEEWRHGKKLVPQEWIS